MRRWRRRRDPSSGESRHVPHFPECVLQRATLRVLLPVRVSAEDGGAAGLGKGVERGAQAVGRAQAAEGGQHLLLAPVFVRGVGVVVVVGNGRSGRRRPRLAF